MPPSSFHVIKLTVTKSIFHPISFNCNCVILVCTSPVLHRYSHGCTYEISLDYVVKHCKHYRTEVFSRQKIQAEVFVRKLNFNFLLPEDCHVLMLAVKNNFFRSLSTVRPLCYSIQAVMDARTVITIPVKHYVNMLSTTVIITV